jgi:hypothetical protein
LSLKTFSNLFVHLFIDLYDGYAGRYGAPFFKFTFFQWSPNTCRCHGDIGIV